MWCISLWREFFLSFSWRCRRSEDLRALWPGSVWGRNIFVEFEVLLHTPYTSLLRGSSHQTHWLNIGSYSFYNLSQLLFSGFLFPFCEQRASVCSSVMMRAVKMLRGMTVYVMWQAVMCVVAVRAALASTAVYVCVGWARRMLPLPAFCANVHW